MMRKIMSSGVFDVLNVGHINILTQAKKMGDYLVVGIQSDESVLEQKGRYPILNIEERKAQIGALTFVDEIIEYHDVDQRRLWDRVMPDAIVQGEDYLQSADRTKALEYFEANGVELHLFPRTPGISSTEIKKRILRNSLKDPEHLRNIKLLPVKDLCLYEEYDKHKVPVLMGKIKTEGVLKNPISVGVMNGRYIVVDGVNRLEAVKRLGCNYITALTLPYNDIDLTNNIHFLYKGRRTRLSEFTSTRGQKIEFKKRTHAEIYDLISRAEMIPNGETWHRPPYHVINFEVSVRDLTKGVDIDER
ncbi:MAG TPA: adenylyltransferase/cytidyltransferase family protein, partial [Candidatus Saccharimonadia bacterium]|nr:adenylyltransferase/cytidyltransferase family protein [Candidatus Saccharimonadia bacterium]